MSRWKKSFDIVLMATNRTGHSPGTKAQGALSGARACRAPVKRMTPTARARRRRLVEGVPGGRYIVVANHQSMFDIPILGSLLFSSFPKYISKRSLGRWIPSVSYNLRRGGHVLIERSDGPAALAAIRELGARVRTGQASAVLLPDGTRARRGPLGKFKRAGTLALLDAAPDAPVLPVVIDESWRLLYHNCLPVPWGVRVYVRLGPPIARRRGEDPAALLDRVNDEIAATLARRRATAGGSCVDAPAVAAAPSG